MAGGSAPLKDHTETQPGELHKYPTPTVDFLIIKKQPLTTLPTYIALNTPDMSAIKCFVSVLAAVSSVTLAAPAVQSDKACTDTICAPASCQGLPPMAADGSNMDEVMGACFAIPENTAPSKTTGNNTFLGPMRHQPACGVDFAYLRFGQQAGDEPPLVMIQGSASTMAEWTTLLLWQLAQTREVIVFDNQGTGFSVDNTNKTLSIRGMAKSTLCLLRSLNITHADVFGFSMGGQIAIAMTTLAGQGKFRDITLRKVISSAGDAGSNNTIPPSQEFLDTVSAGNMTAEEIQSAYLLFFFPAALAPATRSCLVCQYAVGISRFPFEEPAVTAAASTAQTAAEIAWLESSAVWDAVANATTPLLLLTGSADAIVPPQNQQNLASQYARGNGNLVMVSGWPSAGHGVQYTYMDSVIAQIDGFLLF